MTEGDWAILYAALGFSFSAADHMVHGKEGFLL
jgi:hypothetical protein